MLSVNIVVHRLANDKWLDKSASYWGSNLLCNIMLGFRRKIKQL